LVHRVFLALLAAAAAVGCMGEENVGAPTTTPRAPRAQPTTTQAMSPPALIRVLDGDRRRAVRGATVRIGDTGASADSSGVARLDVDATGRARARVSAPGYIPRVLRVSLQSDRPETVHLWRRDLQWPLYGATPARTQAHPGIKLRPPFRAVWKRKLGSLLEFPAVVWEGVAYIANIRGHLTAISMRNGRVVWRKRIGATAASSPAIDEKRRELVVTTKAPGRVTIVDMDTGKIRWRRATARAEASPVIAGGIAYFGDEGGRVYALDLRRRKMRWVFSGADKITSSPALAGRRLYFGDYAGRVFALNARSGRRVWTGSAGTRVYGTVAVGGGRVFAPSVFSGLSALSARTGALRWRIPVGVYLYSSPAYYRGRVYFGTYAGAVYCADARSGRILWRRSTGAPVSGAVVVVAGVVYAGSFNGRINAWHWRTGRTLWRFPHGRYVPVSGNGSRLLMHGGGTIWAVAPVKRKR
jgi:outer membrane protein assembly factor BamB